MSEVETEQIPLDAVATTVIGAEMVKAFPKEEKKAPPPAPISMEKGVAVATTIEAQYRLATAMYKGGMVPKAYQSAEAVMAGMQFAAELGLPSLSGLRQIALVNGSPSIFGDLPLALCYKQKLVKEHKAVVFDKEYKTISLENKNLQAEVFGAWCKMKRVGGGEIETVFTVDDAKKANLWGKSGPWSAYPKRMLELRARSLAIKNLFPDAIMGAAIAEYDYNTLPDDKGEVRDVPEAGASRQKEALSLLQLPKGEA